MNPTYARNTTATVHPWIGSGRKRRHEMLGRREGNPPNETGDGQMATQTSGASTSASTPSPDDVRAGLGETIHAVRATADSVGERVPEVIETVQANARQGLDTMRSWPEPTRKLAATFSVGLGLGLAVAGAPRVVVAVALVPAIIVGGMYASRVEAA